METFFTNIRKDLFNNTLYSITETEDGNHELIINAVGIPPEKLKVKVSEDKIGITTDKLETISPFTEPIDVTFKLSSDLDGTKSKSSYQNGLLIVSLNRKENRKFKELKIEY